MYLRKEKPDDSAAIRHLTDEAFSRVPYSNQREGEIVDALRAASALTLSLVAVDGRSVVGHVAFSPVQIGGEDKGWYALGPISVQPERQGEGIGGHSSVKVSLCCGPMARKVAFWWATPAITDVSVSKPIRALKCRA